MASSLRILYVMDPPSRILVDKDTTFAFMCEGDRRGHEQYYCGIEDLFVDRSTPQAAVRVIRAQPGTLPTLGAASTRALTWFDAVLMRKDPPFDMAFFFSTHVLGLVDPKVTFVMNDPRGLRDANEKLYALHFPEVIPDTFVSGDATRLKAFMETVGGEMIVKPLDGCGGAGIFHVHRTDRNINAILELSTANGTRLVMAQRYLKAVRDEGDKRLIVLAGEPLGAVRRVPREDEHRGNIHVGGRVERGVVDARDREICRLMAPRLAADGLYFVGLDVIGGFVTEVNVTSPTGIQEIDRLDGVCLEAKVVDLIERRAATLDRPAR
jgi:glutathione synthase